MHLFPHSFPPGALTVLHVETLASNTCFDFVKSCHLCLSQCSSDIVNLNASTFVIKPHLGDTDPGGFFSHQCLTISVRQVLSALGKGFFCLTLCQLSTSTQFYGLQNCWLLPKFIPSSCKGLQISVCAHGMDDLNGFWPLLVSLKAHMRLVSVSLLGNCEVISLVM